MVINEAGAARTPVLQHAQEYRGKPVDFRLGNEPETLAIDEKLYAELADVEANPLEEVSLPGMSDGRKKRVVQLAFMLMVQTKNRAIQMITRLSDPVTGTQDLETISGSVGAGEQRSISSDADATAAMFSHGPWTSGNVLYCSTRRRIWTRTGTQSKHQYWYTPTGFRVVEICQTDRDETAEV